MLEIKIREKENVVILDLEGNIDINASNLIETIGWAITSRSKNILCNFEEINLVDYVGISIIAVAYKNVLNHKGKLRFYNVPFHIKKIFCVVGLDRVLQSYINEEKALHTIKEDETISKIVNTKLRRKFKRIDLRKDIEFWQKFGQDKTFYKGKIINLSALGAFILSDKLFPLGDTLSTRLYLMPQPGIIEADVKVVWLADEEIQELESPAMGLEFYNISTEKQEQIVKFVDKHLTHIPQE